MTDTTPSNPEPSPGKVVKVAITKKQQKIVQVDPDRCLSAINPRSLEELEWESLVAQVEAERGMITEPLLLWKLDPDAPEWDTIGDGKFANLSHEERGLSFITIRGHRRSTVARYIKANRQKFPADIVDNAQTVPAQILSGITLDRAESLTMDDEAKKSLKKWETVKVVFQRLRKDHKTTDIAVDIPQLLYKALRPKGEALYAEVSLIDDGTARNNKFKADLRNGLDTWIRTCYHVGPALEEQFLLHFKVKEDRRPLLKGQRLLIDCKREHIAELQKIYNDSYDDSWVPVTRIDRDETDTAIVEGGSKAVKAYLLKKMEEFRNPETIPRSPTLPKRSDRDNAKTSARSECGSLFGAFYCGLPSEGRQEADEKAYFREQREITRRELRSTMSGPVQILIDAENAERDMAKVQTAYRNVDALVCEVLELRAKVENLTKKVAPKKGK